MICNMAAKRRPERDKAFEIWRDSNKKTPLKEIAEQLGVAETLIRKWKCQDKWDTKSNGNVTNGNGNVTNENDKSNGNVTVQENSMKRRGPPIGSKNAKGHGAPKGNKNALGNRGGRGMPGNKNAVTTGEYESIWFDCLTEEEQALCYAINTDTLIQVENDIRLSTLRERRM
ncbi:MAG: terminase, partial [Sporomusa sp.]|nr:terminase [Sporomusa sp.]